MTEINEKIFKAYDVRGLFPSELNETNAFRIGQAIADYFFPTQLLIGRDARESSFPLFQAISEGVMKQGADVIDIGICTSPMFYWAVASGGYDVGIMITASHNPQEYNGIKIVKKMALPLGMGLGLEAIKDLVLEGNFHESQKIGSLKSVDLINDYTNYLKSYQTEKLDTTLKMVFDSSGGPAGKIAKRLFENQFNIIDLNFDPNPSKIPEPNPLKPEIRKEAEDTVIAQRADGAFLWDGDGDRFFVLDEKARLIPGHFASAVLAEHILKNHPDEKVVCDLRLSRATFKTIERNSGIPIMNRVGHSYIKNRMKEENAVFGAEMSGHYYFRGPMSLGLQNFYSDNGIIPAIYLLEIMSQKTKKLSELFDPFFEKYFVSDEINFKVRNTQQALKEIEDLSQKDILQTGGEIIKLDGLTVMHKDWWFNVRPSNTEPVMRVVIEADTKELLKEKIDFITRLMQGFK